MTAPSWTPPNDEQLERLTASDDLPVPASQDDECLTSAEGMPTQVGPPISADDKPPTETATAVAWSQEPPGDIPAELETDRLWRAAWRDAAIMVIAALALATAVGVGLSLLFDHRNNPPSTPTASAPPTTTAPPTTATAPPTTSVVPTPSTTTVMVPPTVIVPPPTIILPPPTPRQPLPPPPASESEKALLFVYLANQAGITITDVSAAVKSAHDVCADLRQGATKQVEARATQSNTGMSPSAAVAIIDATTVVYCPDEYGPWTYFPNR
ncbi:DUF732 domain-containing protein [Mycobacterium sp. E3339]|uniref:DUF732 domain-containing protein n=1 Tax=Mycobacterium sp. E3339 TaxID=1834146 RepID=UPI0012E8CDF7|nr:DUF732 domain-containing protein [Mycobacterium sp. E3339]